MKKEGLEWINVVRKKDSRRKRRSIEGWHKVQKRKEGCCNKGGKKKSSREGKKGWWNEE